MTWTSAGGGGPYRSLAGRLRDELATPTPVPPPPSDAAIQRLNDAIGPENRARGIYPQGPRSGYDYAETIASTVPGFNAMRRAYGLAMDIGTGRRNAVTLGPNNVEPASGVGPSDFRPLELVPPGSAEQALPSARLAPLTSVGPSSLTQVPNALMYGAAQPSRLLSQAIGEIPAPGVRAFLPAWAGGEFKVKPIKEQDPVTQFIAQSIPYVAAPEAGFAVFGASLPATLKEQVGAYHRGEISGQQLAGNLALTLGPLIAPELAKLGVKGVAGAARLAKSPEGKALWTKLASERGAAEIPGEPTSLAARMTPEQEQAAITGQMENRLLGLRSPAGPLSDALAGREGNATAPAPETRPPAAQEAAVPPIEARPVEPAIPQDVAPPAAFTGQTAPAVGGGEPPVPPKPPVATGGGGELPPGGEVLPPVNARFIQAMKEGTLTNPAERARLLSEGRARQVGGASTVALGEGDFQTRLARAGAAMKTGSLLPEMQGVSERFAPEDLKALTDQIDNALEKKDISTFQWKNAGDAFTRLMLGGKQLEPAEKRLLGQIFGPEFEAALPMTQHQWSLWNEAIGVMGLPQTFAASFDLSAPLRQGWMLGTSHPIIWAKTFPAMFKAAATEGGAAKVMTSIGSNPWVKGVGELDGYGFKDVGGRIGDLGISTEAGVREGQFASLNNSFISRMAQRFPGIRQSERGFVVMINKLRADVYASEAQRMWDAGVRDTRQYADLAKVINHATGYGDITLGNIAQGANAFFAPRNLVARFQVLMDPFTKSGSLLEPSARQLAAKNLLAFVGVNGTLVSLLAATGVGSVTWDARRTDFGKLVSGNTRIDPWAGFSPLARLVVQEATGDRINASGSISSADRKQIAINFVRGKLGPVPSLVTDLFAGGKNAIGEPVDLTSPSNVRTQLYNRMVSFFAQDMNEAIQSGGLKGGLLATSGFFGTGVQTYNVPSTDLRNAQDTAAKAAGFKDFADLQVNGTRQQVDAISADPNVAKATTAYQQSLDQGNKQTAALRQAQERDDGALQSGSLTPSQWRDALHTRQAIAGFQMAQRPDSRTGDPTIDNYYAIFNDPALVDQATGQPVDRSALSDALDSYRAKLTAGQTRLLDNTTGLGTNDTTTVRQYKAAVRTIANSGYFDLRDTAARYWGQQHGVSIRDYSQFMRALQAEANKYSARPEDAQAFKDLQSLITDGAQHFRERNPSIDAYLVQWGYVSKPRTTEAAAILRQRTGVNVPVAQ